MKEAPQEGSLATKKGNDTATFIMDETARLLYKDFDGIDGSDHADYSDSESALIELFTQEEKKLDYYRLLLAQLTTLFTGILANSRFAALDKENNKKIRVFIETLQRIAKFPKFDGKIHCRLRGQQCPSDKIGSESYDYELSFGSFILDYQVAQIVEQREPFKGRALYSKLMEAFKGLSAMDIFNFTINIGKGTKDDYRRINKTIRHLMHFYMHDRRDDDKIVNDEYGIPSINLTLLAAANNVKPYSLGNLVNKLKPLLLDAKQESNLSLIATVYDAILASRQYRGKLKRMPIEVNNLQLIMPNLRTDPQRTAQVVKISRLVLSKYGSNPKMASEVISSISSEGYTNIRSDIMGKRLNLATDFLHLTEKNTDHEEIRKEALQNIEDGLNQLPDEIYDNIKIEGKDVSSITEEGKINIWSLHETIFGLLSFFKRRAVIKKKVQDISNGNILFDSEDYAVIARNFKITEQEASHLINLLKSCFDQHGNFRRNFFEKNIPKFVQYESRVFGFLWHYLKELKSRKDRVSFLNALQLLVAQIKHPEEALETLLKDIFGPSATIRYSDRNGLILATILLRYTNKEERSNIELTPEEVLLVRSGLNQDMVQVVKNYFAISHEKIMQKTRIMTEILFKVSALNELEAEQMPPRFLLYLKRELMIFLSLVGNKAAKSIVHGVVKEFGNPHSTYYKEMVDKNNLRHSLLLLQVAARGLRRLIEFQANTILDEIVRKEEAYHNLFEDPSFQKYVKIVMDRIHSPNGYIAR